MLFDYLYNISYETPANTSQHQPTPANTSNLGRIYLFLLMLIVISIPKIKAQLISDSKIDMCGTEISSESYLNDPFFGNNQALVDLLIENGVNISENYLNTLDERTGHSQRDAEPFSSESTVYYIPVKVWVYRNDNGTGNVNTIQVQQVIDGLNDIFNPVTNIQFYRLCDINFVNNSNYANNGDQYFDDFTLINKISGALNVHFIIKSGAKWVGRANFPFLPFSSNNPRAYSCAIKYTWEDGSDSNFSINQLSQILAHEVGHTLGLYHTHQGRCNGNNEDCGNCLQESVSRTKTQAIGCVSTAGQKKCEVNGDLLCDTPADPFLRDSQNNHKVSYNFFTNECNYILRCV